MLTLVDSVLDMILARFNREMSPAHEDAGAEEDTQSMRDVRSQCLEEEEAEQQAHPVLVASCKHWHPVGEVVNDPALSEGTTARTSILYVDVGSKLTIVVSTFCPLGTEPIRPWSYRHSPIVPLPLFTFR